MASNRLIKKLRDTMLRMHRDESGAIVLLCFAGCLFLFAVSLILYDAGSLSRDKVDVQMAADTAGYSQAAVKARSMNMVAFANVGKRTITGIRNMYFYQYPSYMTWLSGQCSKCCCGMICGCWTECFNCIGNWISLVPIFEGIDFMFFMMGRFAGDDLTDHLEALDSYQEEMGEYAAYWAFGEGIVRGVRNGANVVTTYPMPDTETYGGLPIERGDGFAAPMEACLAPTFIFNPSSPGTLLEWRTNYKVLEDRSVSSPNIASEGPAERVNIALSNAACLTTMNSLFSDAEAATPYHVRDHGSDDKNMMDRSNIVWSYRYNPEYSGKLRDNYDAVLSKDYDTNLMGMPHGGLWGMARSEVHYPERNLPHVPGFDRPNGMWLFHPSWVGKLRPVVLKDEDPPVDPSDMWSEARDMSVQAPLFGVGAGDMAKDLIYMEKVTRGMDGQIDGKEALDGISK